MSESNGNALRLANHLLDDAYGFERERDYPAAVSRARAAALSLGRFGPPASLDAAEVAIAYERFAASERAWRQEVEARAARFRAREVAEADRWPDA